MRARLCTPGHILYAYPVPVPFTYALVRLRRAYALYSAIRPFDLRSFLSVLFREGIFPKSTQVSF